VGGLQPLFVVAMAPAEGSTGKTFSLDDARKHTSDKDCWLIVHGKVYDVTDFLEEHPGGYDIILTSAGELERARVCVVRPPSFLLLACPPALALRPRALNARPLGRPTRQARTPRRTLRRSGTATARASCWRSTSSARMRCVVCVLFFSLRSQRASNGQ
jgi:hypothetical protein